MEVTLEQMLSAREARAFAQLSLGQQYGLPLVCFSMNIPGPVKNSPAIRAAFREGCLQLDLALAAARFPIVYRAEQDAVTGCEAIYVIDAPAGAIKAITTELEDSLPMGRLYDMDVLLPQGQKLDRDCVSGGPRPCIVCGQPGRGCASRRIHSVPELQKATRSIIWAGLDAVRRQRIAALAVRALLDEACTTPKPGLVDREGSGSHRDMDIFTFTASAAALEPYFARCAALGQESREEEPSSLFPRLRRAGQQADRDMLLATGGVNTHKGAIYTLGILCGAAGRLWTPETAVPEAHALLDACAAIAGPWVQADFRAMESGAVNTAGARLYRDHGIRGIRGQMAEGLPILRDTALPLLDSLLGRGMSRNDAGVQVLLHLIAELKDTNMVARGGPEKAEQARQTVRALLSREPRPTHEALSRLNEAFIRDNLSPGGCADLLAAAFLVYDLTIPQESRL